MPNSFRHRRDFRQSRTDVVVKGVGSETVGGVLQFVWARYTTHTADYPCRYLPNGWGGEPISSSEIATVAKATEAATAIGQIVWGALGQLVWRTDGVPVGGTAITYLHEGDLIALTDPVEGQDRTVYPIREIKRAASTTGHPFYEITVGDVQPSMTDILRGVTVTARIQQQLRAGGAGDAPGTGLGNSGGVGVPKQIPLTKTPTNSAKSTVLPQFNDTPGLTLQGNPQDRDPTTPLATSAYAPPFAVKPAATVSAPDPAPGTWVTHGDGRPHPQVYPMGFTTNGTSAPIAVPWDTAIDRIKVKGTGSVVINKNGVAATSAFSPAAGWQAVSPPVVLLDSADDTWSVTVSGVSGAGLSVTISEP